MPSFVDDVIDSAPPGTNPYGFAADFVAAIVPEKPEWYYVQLVASGVFAVINLALTIASIGLLLRRRMAGEKGKLWWFQLRYGHSSGLPYIVPNAIVMFLTWNLLFMGLMQPYIWLNFVAWKNPSLTITSQMYFWYGFTFIWDGAGMWTSAFGTLYATLLPYLGTTRRFRYLHPVAMNIFCFLPPIGLAVTQIVSTAFSAKAWSDLIHTQFGLVGLLRELASQWLATSGASIDDAGRSEASSLGTLFLQQKTASEAAFVRSAYTCGAWYTLCLLLFTPVAVWLVLVLQRAVRSQGRHFSTSVVSPSAARIPSFAVVSGHFQQSGLDHQSSQFGIGQLPTSLSVTESHSPGRNEAAGFTQPMPTRPHDVVSGDAKRLKRAYYTALLQFLATFICLGTAAGSWLWIAADAGRLIVNPNLHAVAILLTIWVFVVVGVFVNIFILIRMRNTHDGGSSQPVRTSRPRLGDTIRLPSLKRGRSNEKPLPQVPLYVLKETTTDIMVDEDSHSLREDRKKERQWMGDGASA